MRPKPGPDRTNPNDRTTPKRISDGFGVYNPDKPNNKWKSEKEYKAKTDDRYGFTDENWKDAFDQAAKKNVPVVVHFGGQKTNDAEKLVDGPGKRSMENNKNAVHIYVDKQRLLEGEDKNSDLANFVKQKVHTGGKLDLAYTGIFALKPGDGGKPELGKMVANTWGGRSEIDSIIKDQLQYAQNRMDQHKGKFNVDDSNPDKKPDEKPEEKEKPTDKVDEKPDNKIEKPKPAEVKVLEDVFNQRNEIYENINKAGRSFTGPKDNRSAIEKALRFETGKGELPKLTVAERESHLNKAVEAADKVDPKQVDQARKILEEQIKLRAEKGKDLKGESKQNNQKEMEMLKRQAETLKLLDNVDAKTRMERGLFQLDESNYDKGTKDIKEAFKRDPELAKNQAYVDRIARSPYLIDQLKKDFPDLPIEAARERLKTEDTTDGEKKPEAEIKKDDLDVMPDWKSGEKEDKKPQPENDADKTVDETPEKKPETKPEKTENLADKASKEEKQEAYNRLTQSFGQIQKLISSIGPDTPFSEAEKLYGQALTLADGKAVGSFPGLKPQDVRLMQDTFKQAIEEENGSDKPDQAKLKFLGNNLKILEDFEGASDKIKLQRGWNRINNGSDSEWFSKGIKDLGEVAKNDPKVLDQKVSTVKGDISLSRAVVQVGFDKGSTAKEIKEALPFDSIDRAVDKLPQSVYVRSPEGLQELAKTAHFKGQDIFIKVGQEKGSYKCAPCEAGNKHVFSNSEVKDTLKENTVKGEFNLLDIEGKMTADNPTISFMTDQMDLKGTPAYAIARPEKQADGSFEIKVVEQAKAKDLFDSLSAMAKFDEQLAKGSIDRSKHASMVAPHAERATKALLEFLKKN